MTLKEKLKKQLDTATPTLNRPYYQSGKLEKVADEFAIGFADWIRVCKLKGRPYDFENIVELLETYKEEKGL